MNGNFSDSEDSGKKGSPQERHLASLHGYADSNKSGRQTTLKSGYLKKQGGKMRGWNERWFVLKGDHLHYHKDENGKSSVSQIQIFGYLKLFYCRITMPKHVARNCSCSFCHVANTFYSDKCWLSKTKQNRNE